jgi:sulfur carrier protein
MRVRLNGEDRDLPEGVTIGALLESMGLRRDGIAVAVDRQVVPRGDHDRTVLKEGSDVEVIRAVGGG